MFRSSQNLGTQNSSLGDYTKRLVSMAPEVRSMFPHVEALLRLLLVNPASSATAERSFSCLRRLKTYLRSTMGQSRLNHVAVCNVHKTVLEDIRVEELIKQFVLLKDNRIAIFGNVIV